MELSIVIGGSDDPLKIQSAERQHCTISHQNIHRTIYSSENVIAIAINERPPNVNQILFSKKSAKIAHVSKYILVIGQPFLNFLILKGQKNSYSAADPFLEKIEGFGKKLTTDIVLNQSPQ